MNILLALYLCSSAVILLILAVIGWRHRLVQAGREFVLLSASIALMVLFYGLELTQERMEVFKLILRLEWFPAPYIPTFWVLFSAVWCGYGHLVNRAVRIALLMFSTVTLILAQTNDYHRLIYTALWVDTSGSFPLLLAQNGYWFWVEFAYANTCILIANVMFVRQFHNARPLHRRQALIMMLASFIPWLAHVGYAMDIGHGIYLTAFGLALSGLLFAWGVFRQHLLDITPVARHELVEMMRDPVLVFDEDGRLMDHNQAACRLLHDAENHETEITKADIARRAPELAKALDRAEQGKPHTFHYADMVFSLSLTILRPTANKTLALCLLHDITEKSQAEENLRLLNTTLEERVLREVALNRTKDQVLARQARTAAMGEMVAAIGHQWRQPLSILSLIVQDFYDTAHQEGVPSQTEWDEFKADAMAQILNMSQSIEEFRNFRRSDYKKERFPVIRCLEESLRLCSAQFKEYQIIQVLEIPPEGTSCCFGAPSQLTQVLLNLLVNAKEAIVHSREQNNGHPKQGRVIVTLSDTGERLLITVANNGTVIPDEERDHLFEPYITKGEEQGGGGLGLYLARMLVERDFGGKLSYLARPEGNCFMIDLPVTAEEEE